ncbi:retrovirus-related pol polyprotein from transposon TNT 1-94 [Tanacetum coccineum]|uniref:Retrovirus-related pol polyprotein from transposon TNT 1-94 n=1 Tax=Tanacetum coccineum TaxID=301880 RepID=A0ABQ5DGI0_9ASTR
MAKASPTQAWLWHRRLSHLNFDTINMLSKKDIVNGLPKLKYVKDQLYSSCEMENGVVERRNHTLFEAARMMLSASKLPLFFWAEAIATAFRDGEHLDKMKEKGDTCIFVGYSSMSKGYRVYNKRTKLIVESIHVNFDEIKQMASDNDNSGPTPSKQMTSVDSNTSGLAPQRKKVSDYDNSEPAPHLQEVSPSVDTRDTSLQELELLFSPLYDKYFTAGNPEMCMSALTLSTAKPKNIKEAMADHAWIEVVQEEFHQFDRLNVWEHVDKPFGKTMINLKWLSKNKKDKDNIVIRNKVMDIQEKDKIKAKNDKTEHEKGKSVKSTKSQKSNQVAWEELIDLTSLSFDKLELVDLIIYPVLSKGFCMRTHSQSRNSNRQQQQVNPTFVEPFNLVEPIENQAPPVVTMDYTRTNGSIARAPTGGYEDAIVVPEITADNFEL